MGTTEKLAEFVAGLEYEHIPVEAIGLLKRQCLDTIGVGLAALTEPIAIRKPRSRVIAIKGRSHTTCKRCSEK